MQDVYFDDRHWTIRYLVVDTGTWLTGRHVLISPASITAVDWPGRSVAVKLTREQVEKSPDISSDMPVSRQHEVELAAHYGWPPYWSAAPFGLETISFPTPMPPLPEADADLPKGDPHLRSAHEVKGYRVGASDGMIGHVSDFGFDDERWTILYLVANTGSWLHERLVLIERQGIDSIDWMEGYVTARLTRETIRSGPQFDAAFPVAPEYAEQLARHYRNG